jgi:hypothetical protein
VARALQSWKASEVRQEKARWFMKFAQEMQNMKCKMAVAGLGVTLLFANACYAQQETNPDIFDANPGSTTETGVSALPADDAVYSVSGQPVQVTSSSNPALAPAAQKFVSDQFSLMDSTIAIALAACLTIFGIYAMLLASLKKTRKNPAASANSSRRLQRTMPRPAV